MCHLGSPLLPLHLAGAKQCEVDLVRVEGGQVGSRCRLHFKGSFNKALTGLPCLCKDNKYVAYIPHGWQEYPETTTWNLLGNRQPQ